MEKTPKYIVSIKNTSSNNMEREMLKREEVGGIILYGKNILGYDTTKAFISSIKNVKSSLKVVVDEEGGIVSRFSHLFQNYSQLYCSTLDKKEVKNYYKRRSEFLKEIGIDINFAPIVDIAFDEKSVMYKRSYGSNIEKLIELASVCIEEQKNAGLETCLKHFPGHGRTLIDSHEELPKVGISYEDWMEFEGKVFKKLIELEPEYIMMGHLLFPEIDKKPASSSDYWINDVLKSKLGFKGKVIIDDIQMKGFQGEAKDLNADYVIDTGYSFS